MHYRPKETASSVVNGPSVLQVSRLIQPFYVYQRGYMCFYSTLIFLHAIKDSAIGRCILEHGGEVKWLVSCLS